MGFRRAVKKKKFTKTEYKVFDKKLDFAGANFSAKESNY